MKPAILTSILALAALGTVPRADATQINQHAAGAFHAIVGSDAQYIDYNYMGVRNNHTSDTKTVMLGAAYDYTASRIVNIYGYSNLASAKVECVLHVTDMAGTTLETATLSVTGVTGTWWRQATFSSIPRYGFLYAICDLPPNGRGRIMGYTTGA